MKTAKHITRTLFIAALLLPAMPIFAEPAPPKITVAVYKIQANNCPAETARAVEELMISRLYSTSLFTLMEKSQMDRIAQNNGFKDFDTTNAAQVAKLGKLLNVEKIIVGSVNKVGTYKLEIRAIDVKTGAVDITVPSDADDEEELNKAISKTADTLERFYLGYDRISGKFDIVTSPTLIYPVGSMSDGINFGYGGTIAGSINGMFSDKFNLALLFGAYVMQPDKDKIRSSYLFPIEFIAAHRFTLSRTLTVTPAIGGGVLYTRLVSDKDGQTINGAYVYTSQQYYNYLLDFRTEFSFFVYDRWSMAITPALSILPGKQYNFLPSLGLGFKYAL